jgi:hypothetical protein
MESRRSQPQAAPTEAAVAAAVDELWSADRGTLTQVERLAFQLPAEVFEATVATLKRRRESGSVPNDAGLFVHLLKVELRGRARERAEAEIQAAAVAELPGGHAERVKREDPERYLRTMVGVPGFDAAEFVERYVADDAERLRLLEVADLEVAA